MTPSKSFKTYIADTNGDAIEVEGTLIDYLKAQDYALRSHQAAYDALYGIPIFQTPESEYLKHLFTRAYNPMPLLLSFQGLMRAERKKAEKKQGLDGYIKHASNLVYYASAVHAFDAATANPPLPDAFSLLDSLDSIDHELKGRIKWLYERRKADKYGSDFEMSQFSGFIMAADAGATHKRKRAEPAEDIETLRAQADVAFLKLCLR